MRLPEVGFRYSTEFHISKEKVLQFADFSGDNNPIHVSKKGSVKYGFESPVAHGGILISEISRIIGTEVPGYGALWNDMDFTFKGTVNWNDTVLIELEVLQSSIAAGMIKIGFNASKGNKTVMAGHCRVMCLNSFRRGFAMPEAEKRTALVTGASRGLGLEILKNLLAEGYNLISISRTESEELKLLTEQYKDLFTPLYFDLKNTEQLITEIENYRSKQGRINVIVHAAGPVPVKKSLNTNTYNEIEEFMELYIKCLLELVRLTVPDMKVDNYGRIITIGTSYILGTPPSSMFPYIVGKEALWGLTKSLSVEYAKYGVTANMVSPSMMITSMTSDISNMTKYAESELNPLKRLVEPEEVAKTVTFLCGDGGTFINGTNIPVTGGKI